MYTQNSQNQYYVKWLMNVNHPLPFLCILFFTLNTTASVIASCYKAHDLR